MGALLGGMLLLLVVMISWVLAYGDVMTEWTLYMLGFAIAVLFCGLMTGLIERKRKELPAPKTPPALPGVEAGTRVTLIGTGRAALWPRPVRKALTDPYDVHGYDLGGSE